nr:PREDICTED: acyl-coenzyme A thioesterase 9, mitochondrial-like [Bemisia tabaci]
MLHRKMFLFKLVSRNFYSAPVVHKELCSLRDILRASKYATKSTSGGPASFFSSSSAGAETDEEKIPTLQEIRLNLIEKMGISPGYSLIPKEDKSQLLKYLPQSQDEIPARAMQDSFQAAVIPLSSDVQLQEKYVTSLGFVRIGRLLEDLDLFAVSVVMKHLYNPNVPADIPCPYTIVTLMVDEVSFTDITPKPKKDIKISGQVTYVGKSSVEVTVWLEQKIEESWKRITRAIFVMVCRNSIRTGSALVNKIEPQGERELRIFKNGESRAKKRRLEETESLIKKVPTAEEQALIHTAFTSTLEGEDFCIDRRKLPLGSVWMEDTRVTSTIVSHPEDRNMHNTVFGGYLMRLAVELAWTCGYKFCHGRPTCRKISHILFKNPVEVGSLLQLQAQVIYTEKNLFQILVVAEVLNPLTEKTITTNTFQYTFEAPMIIKTVVPMSYHEAMIYLHGRRAFMKSIDSIGSLSQ